MKTIVKPECDFDDCFPESSKWRGYKYFKEGRVEFVSYDDDFYQGIVHGTQDYEVSYKYDEGDITQMHCTCPFFAKGVNCKHLYAFIFSEFGIEKKEKRYTAEEILYHTKPVEEAEDDFMKTDSDREGLLGTAKGIVGALNSFNEAFGNNKTVAEKREENLEEEMEVYGLDEEEKELVRSGDWEPWQFDRDPDDLEEEDYYYEDEF